MNAAHQLHAAVRRDYGGLGRVNPRKSVHIFFHDRATTACGLSTATVQGIGPVPHDQITCKDCRQRFDTETQKVVSALARQQVASAITDPPSGPGRDLREKSWRRDREVRATERRLDAALLDELADALSDRATRLRMFPRPDGIIADIAVCWCWEDGPCAPHCAATAELIRQTRALARAKRERAA